MEVFITLMDFVEEDMSRKLPASERINHTLLAINYGAILVLAVPVLIGVGRGACRDQAGRRTATGALLMTLAAFGAALFGAARFRASRRPTALVRAGRRISCAALPPRQTVLVTGATGFIGRRLVAGADHRRPSRSSCWRATPPRPRRSIRRSG